MNLSLLSEMITPAVLLSACGTLILSTSNRLGRGSDRVRQMGDRVARLERLTASDAEAQEEWRLVGLVLPKLVHRVRLIHHSLVTLYAALVLLVLASLVIGAAGLAQIDTGRAALLLGLGGVLAMAYAAALLAVESRLSLAANLIEMRFIQDRALRRAGAASAT
ncbi:MAG TPA: DUF2721 domain-containing protein [Planctomycetota bacterium]|nr:DUF2721 domain-containing protein [Planctomycetota bacterium]